MDPVLLTVISMGSVDWYERLRPVIVCPLVSITLVVNPSVAPWATVPEVVPLARFTLIEAGGQVEK